MAVLKTVTTEEAVLQVNEWLGGEPSWETVPGGITNRNFKVTSDGVSYFVKVPGEGTDFIDRGNCHKANLIAYDAGVGARVFAYFEDTGVEVSEWLEGYRTTGMRDMYDREICLAGARAIRKFHDMPDAVLDNTGTVFDQSRDMAARCLETDIMPPWHRTMQYYMDRIEGAFRAAGTPLKPCHNDYRAANFMWNDETKEGRIIDMEYASMSDPIIDLAMWAGAFATEDIMRETVTEYNNGEFDEKLFAMLNLGRIAKEIKWMYWSIQQIANSTLKFDYYSWYTDKANRLRFFLTDNRIDMWLNLLEGRDSWRRPGIWKLEQSPQTDFSSSAPHS